MSPLSLADVVAASADLATTSSRTAKVARLADLLTVASADGPRTATVVAAFLGGRVPHGRLGVGFRSPKHAVE